MPGRSARWSVSAAAGQSGNGLGAGIVDRITSDPAAGVRDADLVFLATPVQTLAEVVAEIIPHLKPGAILTDGGSVKGAVIERSSRFCREDDSFRPRPSNRRNRK